jgi:hypothetical protein
MPTTIQNLVQAAQKNTRSAGESKIQPSTWVQWACDGITGAFQADACLRIQSLRTAAVPTDSISPVPFTLDPAGDPSQYEIPGSLEPFTEALQTYIEFRYHASTPKNADESRAAQECYARFLRLLGIQSEEPRG